jgi:hypothetical protein
MTKFPRTSLRVKQAIKDMTGQWNQVLAEDIPNDLKELLKRLDTIS